MKQVILFFFVLWFAVLGSAVLAVDLWYNHSLHVMNGWIGAALLLTSAMLALPVQLDHVIEKLAPYLPGGLKPKSDA